MRLILIVFGLLLFFGCTTTVDSQPNESQNVSQPEVEQLTCEEYCPTQPHIQCVGQWNISGVYPDCLCSFECDISDVVDQNETANETDQVDEKPEDQEPDTR